MIYESGETIQLHCDIFPAFVRGENLPDGIPSHGIRKRIVVTERCMTVLWQVGQDIQRQDIELLPEQTSQTTLRGGPVGLWTVGRDYGCAGCGAAGVKNLKVWPGHPFTQVPRAELAQRALRDDKTYGLPSAHRYTRI